MTMFGVSDLFTFIDKSYMFGPFLLDRPIDTGMVRL